MPGSDGASGHRLLATLLSAHQSGTPVTCRARCLAAAAAPPPSDTARFVSKDRVHLKQEEVGVPLDVAMKHDLVNCFFWDYEEIIILGNSVTHPVDRDRLSKEKDETLSA